MTQGLNVNRVVSVLVNLSPLAAGRRNFGEMLIIGDSPVVGTVERLRQYSDLEGVANDFGLSAPEYDAAAVFFGQSPAPSRLNVGRWIATDAPAELTGGILNSTESLLSAWTSITNGSVVFSIDGAAHSLTALNFSAATNLNQVATIITAAAGMDGDGVLTWTGSRFVLQTVSDGAAAEIGYASVGASGVSIHALLKLSSATASSIAQGADAETPAEAVEALGDLSGAWYGATFASTEAITDDEHVAVAAFINGASTSRLYAVTITTTGVLDAVVTNDLATRLKDLNYRRAFTQYSENAHAAASVLGRMSTVNFNGSLTAITLKFKQEPGVAPEVLTSTQANTLADKRANVFVMYQNATAILQEGVMSGQAYIDEMHNLDWLQNAVQTEIYNLLYTSSTKVPQTDGGVNQIKAAIASVLSQAVANGIVAPGQWNADGFGQLQRGDYLDSGFYIYCPPIALQSQSDREARRTPPMQVAVKLAGAFHSVDVIINVNR